jgi:hypothetical protein
MRVQENPGIERKIDQVPGTRVCDHSPLYYRMRRSSRSCVARRTDRERTVNGQPERVFDPIARAQDTGRVLAEIELRP